MIETMRLVVIRANKMNEIIQHLDAAAGDRRSLLIKVLDNLKCYHSLMFFIFFSTVLKYSTVKLVMFLTSDDKLWEATEKAMAQSDDEISELALSIADCTHVEE